VTTARLSGGTQPASRCCPTGVGDLAAVLTVTGVFLGTVAGLAGILPFTLVRTDSVWPGQGLGIWLTIVAIAAAATVGTSLVTARRTLRTPAVDAVALAA